MRSFAKIITSIGYFFYIFTAIQLQTAALTINKHEIRDLEDHTAFFQQESLSWSISNLINNTNNVTQCAGIRLLGGYNTLGSNAVFQKTYTNLPSHEIVYFAISFWVLDIQDNRNLFTIYFDGQSVNTWSSAVLVGMSSGNSCGSSARDFPSIIVKGKAIHSGDTITLKIQSQIGSLGSPSLPSFGFRDVNLLFANSSSLLETSSYCTFTSTTLSLTSCLCPTQQYNTLSIPVCASCDSSCESCLGPSKNQCTSCRDGYWFDGDMCSQCHASCKQCNGTSQSSCLRCAADRFIYWNGTCQSSCESPLISRTEGDNKYCDLPCAKFEHFNTLENKCQTTCASPYVSTTQGDLKLCNSPCQSTEFYDSEQEACVSSCEAPMIQEVDGLLVLCMLPNPLTNTSLMTIVNNSSSSSTSSGSETFNISSNSSTLDASKTSNEPTSANHLETKSIFNNTIIILNKCTTYLAFPLAMLGSFLRPSDPTPLIVLAFFDFPKYMQYIQVPYPEEVLRRFESTQFEVFSFWSLLKTTAPRIIEENLPKHSLPETFERRNLHSSFLINEWNSIFTFMVSIFIVIICWPVCILLQKSNKNPLMFAGKRTKLLTRWNLFLLILFANYGNLTLFTSLELRTLKIDSFATWSSFITALFIISLSSWLICKIIYLSRQITKISTVAIHPLPSTSPISSNQRELFLKRWESSQILYRGFKNGSFATQAYLFFFASRAILTYLIVAWLYPYPLVQITLIASINLGMLCYTLIKRPIRHLLTMIACGIYETIILGVNICIMVLVIYDNDPGSEKSQNLLGHICIISNSAIYFASIIILLVALILNMRQALKPSKVSPLKIVNTNLKQNLQFFNHESEKFQNPHIHISSLECSTRYLQSNSVRSQNQSNPVSNRDNISDSPREKREQEDPAKSSIVKQDLKFHKPSTFCSPNKHLISDFFKINSLNHERDQITLSPSSNQTTIHSLGLSPMNENSRSQLPKETKLSFSSALQGHEHRLILLKKLAVKYKKSNSQYSEGQMTTNDKTNVNEITPPTSIKKLSPNGQFQINPENLSINASFISDFSSDKLDENSQNKVMIQKRIGLRSRKMSQEVKSNKQNTNDKNEENFTLNKDRRRSYQPGCLNTKKKLETIIEVKFINQEDPLHEENIVKITFPTNSRLNLKKTLYS